MYRNKVCPTAGPTCPASLSASLASSVVVDFVPLVVLELEHRKWSALPSSGNVSRARNFLLRTRTPRPRQKSAGSRYYRADLQFLDQVSYVGSTALAMSGTRRILHGRERGSAFYSFDAEPCFENSHTRIGGKSRGIKPRHLPCCSEKLYNPKGGARREQSDQRDTNSGVSCLFS